LLLRHVVPFAALEALAKRVFVEVALQDFAMPGKKPSISRASILSGLTRSAGSAWPWPWPQRSPHPHGRRPARRVDRHQSVRRQQAHRHRHMAPPAVVYRQPVIIVPRQVAVVQQRLELHVPPSHQKHWAKHCRRYNACGQPVYFVQEDWVRERYAEQHGDDERGGHRGKKSRGRHGGD
jgi:hypothetical protein